MEVWPNEALVTVNIRRNQLKYIVAAQKLQVKVIKHQYERAIVAVVASIATQTRAAIEIIRFLNISFPPSYVISSTLRIISSRCESKDAGLYLKH